jgi:hypothetical protein
MEGPMTRGPVTGRQVVQAVVAILLATAVVPPAAAWWLNSRRIAMTTDRAVSAASRGPRGRGGVVCGPGRLPALTADRVSASHAEWLGQASVDPAAFGPGMPTDAWGRCFLMNDRWILSAGPNGAIDTPLTSASLAGDDIGAARR